MKRTFRFSVRIKDCNKVFAEGFEPGEFVIQDIEFDVPEHYSKTMLAAALLNKQREILDENVEIVMNEVVTN